MWQIWGIKPGEFGWMLLEELRFEEQARWRCMELGGYGYRTALRNSETGETVFDPSPRFYG